MRRSKLTTDLEGSSASLRYEGEPGLLARAKAKGETSAFAGKRKWSRHELGTRINIAADPTVSSTIWEVTLHNISGGGVGFWSKRSLEIGSRVYVHDEMGTPARWLSATVCHCTAGLRGHLIGASFAEPMQEDADLPTHQDFEELPDDGGALIAGSIVWPLRVQWMVGIAAAGALTIAIARFVLPFIGLTGSTWLILPIELLIAGAIGALVGLLLSHKDHLFVTSLRRALRGLATGKHFRFDLASTTTREFVSIGRAFRELCNKWQYRARDEQIQRRRLEEITRMKMNLLSIVSHDLRTPLTSILMYGQMLEEDLDTMAREDQRNFLNIINEECQRLSRLVEDLLVVQRLEADAIQLDMKPVNLGSLVRNTVRSFEPIAHEKTIDVKLACAEQLPHINADADKMTQVITNIISNALKYSRDGGTIKIVVESWGPEVVLRVADNGPGIPRNQWDHIFDRFAQAGDPNVSSVSGFGLGLFIVRRIVHDHQGRIWLNSQLGQGSEFFAAFPAINSAHSMATCSVEGDPEAPSCTILVGDSDPELVARMAQVLRANKHDVLVAHCASRLLEQLDNNDIDILITDVLFPDLDSQELLTRISQRANRLFRTVIHSYEGDGDEYRRLGVDIFLRRPVCLDELLQAVRVATRRRMAAGLTVVLIETTSTSAERFRQVLERSGHSTILAESMHDGVILARDYNADAVVIPKSQLDGNWTELEQFHNDLHHPRLIVLCDSITREDRRRERDYNALAMVCQSGHEDSLVDILMTSKEIEGAGVAL